METLERKPGTPRRPKVEMKFCGGEPAFLTVHFNFILKLDSGFQDKKYLRLGRRTCPRSFF
jgi:hypothetical protein